MAEHRNLYLDLMDDEDLRPPAAAPMAGHALPVDQTLQADQDFNPYDDLLEDEQVMRHDVAKSLPAALVGGAGGYLSTGAGRRPMTPSAATVAGSRVTPVVEALTGAPSGSVSEIYDAMRPAKVAPHITAAARAAAEARVPQVAALPPSVVKVQPTSSGQAWLNKWANIDKPEFVGGVPEAAQTYQRGKSSGKVMGPLEKKFGQRPSLSLQGHAQSAALSEIENAMRVRAELHAYEMQKQAERKAAEDAIKRSAQVEQQAQSSARAAKLAGPLAVLNRILGGAGLGLGAYDAYRRLEEGDKTGAGLTAGATGLGMAAPMLAPLAGAAVGLYDDPEARRKFQESMTPGGAWQKRMEGRFGLD